MPTNTSRDLRIDWLRGLAMTCVIVNHSKLSSLLSWFSYERFWVVTAAEVFVVLSGVVIGMVYGRRLARDGWQAVVRGLSRRALLLYVSFIAVTVSILVLSLMGVDVRQLARDGDHATAWFFDPVSMDIAAWRDLLLMRSGPWAFEIIGLYVWLVLAAVPCLLTLHFKGWRPVIAASWALYLAYRLVPLHVTGAEFETVFPLLTWQLLFVHGIAIGYHRHRASTFVGRRPALVPIAAAATAVFLLFAFCNPWADGPSWLHLRLISQERFTYLYGHFFALADLGLGRLLNLAVGLPMGYVLLTACWTRLQAVHALFVTLGQQSLGAFVAHVYGLLVLAHLPLGSNVALNALVQILLVVSIAALLNGIQQTRVKPRQAPAPQAQPLAA